MFSVFVIWFVVAFLTSFFAASIIKRIAIRFDIIDYPSLERKVHKKPVALLGGAAIYFSVFVSVAILLSKSNALTGGEITTFHYAGFLLGGLILMIGGYIDDKYDLPPRVSIVAPVLASLVVIGFGIEVDKLTNPFGGVIVLESWQSDFLVFAWLMVVMYTTKFLDGLDGLATGISSIGALMIMLLSLSLAFFQPDVALLSAICLGAMLGFLLWNIHPASIFLGEGGSTFVGYIVGVLAVISGGKLATALLVLGIPLMDVIWIITRRFRKKGFLQIFKADRKHLHHRLLDLGWSQKSIVLGYLALATSFGGAALFLQSREKLIALLILVFIMFTLAHLLVKSEKREHCP
jgi:UDP-GlcNAc:undecaprenyl-phosphate/decaprenyl-phosphate GlcNAc-1-phosphate transferase